MCISASMMRSFIFLLCTGLVQGLKNHIVYWNSSNPIFRLDNQDHILRVNSENRPQEYDQLHLICPNSGEQHVIYSVSEMEFESCHVTSPRPKIVAICQKPDYFTITFRSFSPTPGGLEFKPGQTYYLISTSTSRDLHRRAGGYCSTHNMKMSINVAENGLKEEKSSGSSGFERSTSSPIYRAVTTPRYSTTSNSIPVYYYRSKTPGIHSSDYIYYYSPRDLVQLKLKAKKHENSINVENETYTAARLTSSAGTWSLNILLVLIPALAVLL